MDEFKVMYGWLAELQPGDEVCREIAGATRNYQLGTVKRVTKLHVVAVFGDTEIKYRRTTGAAVGPMNRNRYLMQVTDRVRETVELRALESWLMTIHDQITRSSGVPLTHLRAMREAYALVETEAPESGS